MLVGVCYLFGSVNSVDFHFSFFVCFYVFVFWGLVLLVAVLLFTCCLLGWYCLWLVSCGLLFVVFGGSLLVVFVVVCRSLGWLVCRALHFDVVCVLVIAGWLRVSIWLLVVSGFACCLLLGEFGLLGFANDC